MEGIPALVLIGPDGRILAKRTDLPAIERTLAERLATAADSSPNRQ